MWHTEHMVDKNKIAESLKQGLINIVQVLVALAVLSVGLTISEYWWDRESFAEHNAGMWWADVLAQCDSTAEELEADFKCINSRDCLLSRDELLAHEERVERFALMCTEKVGD